MNVRMFENVPSGFYGVLQQSKVDTPLDEAIEQATALGHADIAGHCRRYTRSSFAKLTASNRWRILHMAGLTFPVSNLLLPLSNYLVRKSESAKLTLSALERTKQSGRREVSFKTKFPTVLGMVLNRVTMSPLHWLQKLFARSDSALVLYFEAKPSEESIHG